MDQADTWPLARKCHYCLARNGVIGQMMAELAPRTCIIARTFTSDG